MFGSAESEKVRLISREIIFQELYDHDTSTLHFQTDGRTRDVDGSPRGICLGSRRPRGSSVSLALALPQRPSALAWLGLIIFASA